MSIDRWNRDDRAQLNRIEEKLDQLLAGSRSTVVNNVAVDIDEACARKIDQACRPGGILYRYGGGQ